MYIKIISPESSRLSIIPYALISLIGISCCASGITNNPFLHKSAIDLPNGARLRIGTTSLYQKRGVRALAFSPNGKLLASGGGWLGGTTVNIWNVSNGREVMRLKGHGSTVFALSFSPDGKLLASAGGNLGGVFALGLDDPSIILWDMKTGKKVGALEGHNGYVISLLFSPDGNHLVSRGSDDTIRFWDVKNEREIHRISNPKYNTGGPMVFSPDGSIFIFRGRSNQVLIMDAENRKILRTITGAKGAFNFLAFSMDGAEIISVAENKTMRYWDISSGKQVPCRNELQFTGPTDAIYTWNITPDKKTVTAGGHEGIVFLWDSKTGQRKITIEGLNDPIREIVFSPNGEILATGGDGPRIRMWSTNTGKELAAQESHTHQVNSVLFSPDGKKLITGSSDQTIRIWDVKSGKQLKRLDGNRKAIGALSVSPDGKWLLSVGRESRFLCKWRLDTGNKIFERYAYRGDKHALDISPNGKLFAFGGGYGATIWDMRKIKRIHVFKEEFAGFPMSIKFSPNGKTLAVARDNGQLELWDVSSKKNIMKRLVFPRNLFSKKIEMLTSAVFSPDGKSIAYAYPNIHILDINSGKERLKIEQSVMMNQLTFSLDGKYLVGAGFDEVVYVWSVSKGKEIRQIKGHLGPVKSVCFSPDGNILASASDDTTVLLWDWKKIMRGLEKDGSNPDM